MGPRTLRTARAIVALTAAEVVGKIGTLIVMVGAARLLPLTEFGVFAVTLGIGALAAVVPSWGFDTLLVQRGAGAPTVLPALLTEIVALRSAMVITVLAGAGGIAMVMGVPVAIAAPAGCVILACQVETIGDAFRAVAVAREAPGVVATAQLVQRSVTAALVLAVLMIWRSLPAASVAYLVGTTAGVAASVVGAARLGVRPCWGSLTWPGVRELSRASSSGGLHAVASMVLFRIDAVLLAGIAGAAAAGRYAAAYRLLETVIFVAWTVARGVFPVMASSPDERLLRRAMERGLAVLASVFLPYTIVLWCRGEDVLRILYGQPFVDEGVAPLAWLAPAPIFFAAAYLSAYVLMAAGPTPRVLVGSVGALVVNVAMNVTLIPRYGPVAAAAATTVSYAVQTALLFRAAGRPTMARPLLPAALASLPAAGVLLAPLPFAVALTLAAVVYALAWVWLAASFDRDQVRVVRGLWTPERRPDVIAGHVR